MNPSSEMVINSIVDCDEQAAKALISGDLNTAERMYAVGNNLYNKAKARIPGFQEEMDKRFGKVELVNLSKLK